MEVLRTNFSECLPAVADVLDRAAFIAIDTEFSLLVDEEANRPSLFDSGEERYRKLRKIVQSVAVVQFGLSAFEDLSTIGQGGTDSRYVAHTYNFYLYPKAYGPIDVRFKCQASSLEFLCQHSFDFNKFVYDGIPALNQHQRDLLASYLETQVTLAGLDRQVDEEALQRICSGVAAWVCSPATKENDFHVIHAEKTLNEFTIHAELRQRFPDSVWTNFRDNGVVEAVKVSKEKRTELEFTEGQVLKEKTLDYMLGFSKVFDLIVKQQKPIVGHNLFMDLLFMHEKFYQPLPPKLKDFKKNMNRLFPSIFDTKNIIHSEKRKLEDALGFNFQTTSLTELYQIFDSDKGKLGSLYSPNISYASPGKYSQGNRIPHEAGYDSFLAGYVFLRLAHLVATREVKATEASPVRFSWYIHSLREFVNRVNLIRASIDHLSLEMDKKDPPSRRPQLLVIRSRNGLSLEPAFVASCLANFGSVDIRQMSSNSMSIAVGTFRAYREIVEYCATHDKFACFRHRPFKHSPLVRNLLWAAVVAAGAVSAWIVTGS